jgi:hypothetical protein
MPKSKTLPATKAKSKTKSQFASQLSQPEKSNLSNLEFYLSFMFAGRRWFLERGTPRRRLEYVAIFLKSMKTLPPQHKSKKVSARA